MPCRGRGGPGRASGEGAASHSAQRALPLNGEEEEQLNKTCSCFHSELLPPLIAPTTGEDPSEWEGAEPAMSHGRSCSPGSQDAWQRRGESVPYTGLTSPRRRHRDGRKKSDCVLSIRHELEMVGHPWSYDAALRCIAFAPSSSKRLPGKGWTGQPAQLPRLFGRPSATRRS